MLPLYDAIAAAVAKDYDLVTDVSRIELIERGAFDTIARYVMKRMPERGREIRRHALIRPAGLVGALSAGFFALFTPPFEWKDVLGLDDAFHWLGGGKAAEVERLISSLYASTPELRRLREYISLHLQSASVSGAVRALAMSERSLQRHLEQQGTSFRQELTRARVQAAQTFLAESDEKLDSIARRVGCASGSNLGVIFRRLTGETPSHYRERMRG